MLKETAALPAERRARLQGEAWRLLAVVRAFQDMPEAGRFSRAAWALPAASALRRAVPGFAGGHGLDAEGDDNIPSGTPSPAPRSLRARSARRCVQVGHISPAVSVPERSAAAPGGGPWSPPDHPRRAGGGVFSPGGPGPPCGVSFPVGRSRRFLESPALKLLIGDYLQFQSKSSISLFWLPDGANSRFYKKMR